MSTTPPLSPAGTPRPQHKSLPFSASISITPEYLLFPPPHHGRAIQNIIYICNTAATPCVYKLRTQNPNRYVAKPNVAVVAPRTVTRVKVTLCVGKDEAAIPPATQERFRISVKALKRTPGSDVPAKEVWGACKDPVIHERDILAYFSADMPSPPGGMVTFLPERYMTAVATARESAVRPQKKDAAAKEPPQLHTDPMPTVRTDVKATPLPGEDGDPGSGSPQASRQLAFDLDNAVGDGTPAAARAPTAATAAAPAKAVSKKKTKPRTWRTFLWATVLAVVLAYSVGLACRLYAENTIRADDTATTEGAANAEPIPSQLDVVDGNEAPLPEPEPAVPSVEVSDNQVQSGGADEPHEGSPTGDAAPVSGEEQAVPMPPVNEEPPPHDGTPE